MLAGRAGSPIIFQVGHHSARLFASSVKIMAHEHISWKPPSRQTTEPILKVYNTLTRTKVRVFKFRACDNAHPSHVFVPRTSSFQVKEDALNGTTVVLPYTMLRIWGTRGMLFVARKHGPAYLFCAQELRYTRHSSQNHVGLLRL